MRTPARKGRDPQIDAEMDSPIERKGRRERWLPTVAIVGRPNVGKSTLFNRLVGRRQALVHDRPGMTRDRKMEEAHWGKTEFLCIDTGGLDLEIEDPLIESVRDQALLAVEQADVVVLLTAVGEEDNPAEHEILEVLRRSAKPLVLAVNKSDNRKLEAEAQAFYSYGLDEIYPISALHGGGVPEMLDAICGELDKIDPPTTPQVSGGIRIAVVGRQNVGKSTLVNRLLGEQRMIASELPGTTRDAIDTTVETADGELYTLIDTAGIRRRGKVERGFEKLSVLSSMLGMRRADVAVLVIDAAEGITAQDAHIASYCLEEGLSTIVVVNKWDLVEKDEKTADQFTKTLEREWAFMSYAPVVYVSALSGQRTVRIFDLAKRTYLNAERRIPTGRLNRLLEEWVGRRPPPTRSNRRPRIKYMTQTGVHPPSFTVFVNDPELIHFSYKRYLVNRLREAEDYEGTPIRLFLKNKSKRGRYEKGIEEIKTG